MRFDLFRRAVEWCTAALALAMVTVLLLPRRSAGAAILKDMSRSMSIMINAAVAVEQRDSATATRLVAGMDDVSRDSLYGLLSPADRHWLDSMIALGGDDLASGA